MERRRLLTVLGAGTLSLAGCTTSTTPGGTDDPPSGTDTVTPDDGEVGSPTVPANCPTSQDLGVEWPTDLDASTVESFVETYEHVYYREVVVDYEPDSQLDSYGLGGSVNSVTAVGDGWELSYSGSGGIYRPTLWLSATTATPPDWADVVPVSDVDDDLLVGLLEEAAESGEADRHVEPPGETVDRYVDLLASLSDDFDELTGPSTSDALWVDVDGTPVELRAEADSFHGDYWWNAWYYVDERVVRRTTDEATDPRDGEVLECRRPG